MSTHRPADTSFVDAIIGPYACGMKRQVYRRADRGCWTLLDAGPTPEPGVNGFEAIDDFSEKEIYAVGWEGEIWQYDSAMWHRRHDGTHVILVDLVCAGDDQFYVLGQSRKLVRGRGLQREIVNLVGTLKILRGVPASVGVIDTEAGCVPSALPQNIYA